MSELWGNTLSRMVGVWEWQESQEWQELCEWWEYTMQGQGHGLNLQVVPSLKNQGVLNFRLGLQTVEGDKYAET